jgi:hypothetical protein
MDFSRTSTKRFRSGIILSDFLVGMGLASMATVLILGCTMFMGHSFVALGNYANLDRESRNALDKMSQEIRQSNCLIGYATNLLSFSTPKGPVVYSYDSGRQTLTRSLNGIADARPLLHKCTFLQFSIFQRNPIGGTYDQYPTADTNTCKLVQLNWVCARPITGSTQNTECVQSAKIVIRKE